VRGRKLDCMLPLMGCRAGVELVRGWIAAKLTRVHRGNLSVLVAELCWQQALWGVFQLGWVWQDVWCFFWMPLTNMQA
jgi:hypothetical protein